MFHIQDPTLTALASVVACVAFQVPRKHSGPAQTPLFLRPRLKEASLPVALPAALPQTDTCGQIGSWLDAAASVMPD